MGAGGFEPPKALSRQIYSLARLAASVHPRWRCDNLIIEQSKSKHEAAQLTGNVLTSKMRRWRGILSRKDYRTVYCGRPRQRLGLAAPGANVTAPTP